MFFGEYDTDNLENRDLDRKIDEKLDKKKDEKSLFL